MICHVPEYPRNLFVFTVCTARAFHRFFSSSAYYAVIKIAFLSVVIEAALLSPEGEFYSPAPGGQTQQVSRIIKSGEGGKYKTSPPG